MKPIATPTFRKRSDGVSFTAPPSARGSFKLTNVRLNEENFTNQITYCLDQQDFAFLQRFSGWTNSENESISPQMLAALMTAFEISSYRELHAQDQNYQRVKQQQNIQNQQQQQQSSTGQQAHQQNSSTNNNNLNARTSSTQGALERASIIISSANIPGKLEETTIDASSALKHCGLPNNHPSISDQKIQSKIVEAVKGHWLERRKATGTALLPVLRPHPHENGVFRNQQLGERDEPFTSREVRNCLVLWRPSTIMMTSTNNNNPSSDEEKLMIMKQKRKQDKRSTKKLLNNALALMMGIVEREEKRLEHAQLLTAELALARRCRQLPPAVFSSSMIHNAATTSEELLLVNNNNNNNDQQTKNALLEPTMDIGPYGEARRRMMMRNDDQQQNSSSDVPMLQKEKDALLRSLEENLEVSSSSGDDDDEDE